MTNLSAKHFFWHSSHPPAIQILLSTSHTSLDFLSERCLSSYPSAKALIRTQCSNGDNSPTGNRSICIMQSGGSENIKYNMPNSSNDCPTGLEKT
jgi:hypothetical protein